MTQKRMGIFWEVLIFFVLLGAVLVFGLAIRQRTMDNVPASTGYPVAPTPTQANLSTPSPDSKSKPPTPEPGVPAEVVRRGAGAGIIIEDGQAPYPASYFFENTWYAEIGKKTITVYAGAQRSDGVAPLEKPWPGVVVVEVGGSDETGGEYFTPTKDGPVRIVDANGMQLTLVTDSGKAFFFNVDSRKFIMPGPSSPVRRVAGAGTIIESGEASFPKGRYTFKNQWFKDVAGKHITIFAGVDNDNASQGILVIDETPVGQSSASSGQQVYRTPGTFGAVWITAANGDRLTLATNTGGKFTFDVTSRKFTSWPEVSLTVEPTLTSFPVLVAPTGTVVVMPTPTASNATPYP